MPKSGGYISADIKLLRCFQVFLSISWKFFCYSRSLTKPFLRLPLLVWVSVTFILDLLIVFQDRNCPMVKFVSNPGRTFDFTFAEEPSFSVSVYEIYLLTYPLWIRSDRPRAVDDRIVLLLQPVVNQF
jgi:hypothetical protein